MQLRVSSLIIHIRDANDSKYLYYGRNRFISNKNFQHQEERIETKRNAAFILHVCFARSLLHLLLVLGVNIAG